MFILDSGEAFCGCFLEITFVGWFFILFIYLFIFFFSFLIHLIVLSDIFGPDNRQSNVNSISCLGQFLPID